MVQENHMQVHFDAKSVNEGLARMRIYDKYESDAGADCRCKDSSE